MYYELIILGTLMSGSFHGYLIAKIMENIGGPHSRLSPGRLYPLLKRLEEQGFIAVEEASEQRGDTPVSHISSRRYRITGSGQKRFRDLMLDTDSYPGDYGRIFAQKVVYFSFLPPAERLQVIDHYTGYCRSFLEHGTERQAEFARLAKDSPGAIPMPERQLADLLTVMQHTLQGWQQELNWSLFLGERVRGELAPPVVEDDASPD